MFYVYLYIDPITYIPFYVGKGTADRKFSHLKETETTTINKRKHAKIQSIIKKGLTPIIFEAASFTSEIEAYNFEEKLIKFFGRKGFDENGVLTNITLNSNPPSRKGAKLTEEQKVMLSNRMMEVAKTRKSTAGRPPWNKGLKGAQVAWNKGIPTGVGKILSEETKEKLRHYNLGKKKSDETKEKMSKNMKGRIPWNKGKNGIKKTTKPITLINPEGKELTYSSLREACKINNLQYTLMSSVNSGKKTHYKNWRIKPQ